MSRFFSRLVCLISLFMFGNIKAQTSSAKPKALLNHVAIYVVDLQKTTAFYDEMFGFDTIPEPFHDGKHTWYAIAPGVAMHVIQGAGKPKEYFLNQHTCFSVVSVDDFVAKLKAKNRHWYNSKGVIDIITTRIDGVKQIWVTDPDGYYIEVNDAKF